MCVVLNGKNIYLYVCIVGVFSLIFLLTPTLLSLLNPLCSQEFLLLAVAWRRP